MYQTRKKGLKEFEELINSIPDSTGKKGMAFLCSVGPRSMRIHEFVIELTPARELYIYQSYQGQYSLQKSLKEQKALDPTKVLDALKILISPELLDLTEISEEEPTPERVEAYQFLFHATDNFQKLYLSFTPLEYDIGSIPSAPVSLAFAQRIWNIWLRCVANIQDMLSNLATRIQRL